VNLKDAVEIGAAVIASLGGGGAIVFGLSTFLGKLWADRALEREKHHYAEILQEAKTNLDKAVNRYQVELDTLALGHRLRTTEEFSRLGLLWKHVAILSAAFNSAATQGFEIVPADPTERKQYKEEQRRQFFEALAKAQNFFLQEKLFIPKGIADCAESTLREAIKESSFYQLWAIDRDAGVRNDYRIESGKALAAFNDGSKALEKLMREHIDGKR
jgi:hypothetical protein